MKILWIDLNSSYAHSSLALPALHAQVADDDRLQWEVVSATINENVGMVVDEICRHNPDILAGTAWLFNHEVLMHITARVKALLPQCCIALGGPEFLGDNETYLRNHPFVSCVFRGEGEEVVPQWLACWDRPEAWGDIAGLCYLDAEGRYHATVQPAYYALPSWFHPKRAASSTGASPSYNWRPHADASTPAPSA